MNPYTVVSAVWDCVGEETPLVVLPGLIEPAGIWAEDELSGAIDHVHARDTAHAVRLVKEQQS